MVEPHLERAPPQAIGWQCNVCGEPLVPGEMIWRGKILAHEACYTAPDE